MVLKKTNVLARLTQIKQRAEEEEMTDLTAKVILDLLLDYLNDAEIREAVDEISF